MERTPVRSMPQWSSPVHRLLIVLLALTLAGAAAAQPAFACATDQSTVGLPSHDCCGTQRIAPAPVNPCCLTAAPATAQSSNDIQLAPATPHVVTIVVPEPVRAVAPTVGPPPARSVPVYLRQLSLLI